MHKLSSSELAVLSSLGITEAFVMRKLMRVAGQQRARPERPYTHSLDDVSRRIYLALMLNALWTQQPAFLVAQRFDVSRGFLQNLLSNSASFAASIQRFVQASSNIPI